MSVGPGFELRCQYCLDDLITSPQRNWLHASTKDHWCDTAAGHNYATPRAIPYSEFVENGHKYPAPDAYRKARS